MVYLAHDTTLDREVAFALIKTDGLDETSRARIQREAQAMGRLGSHPHIVTVFDLGEEGEQPFMVTELMGGGDVEGLIEDAPNNLLPLDQAVKIAQETCRGLEFAHSRGIVHRDMKPGNVWITTDGVAKIGDFGLAVSLDRSRLTQQGMMVGTVSYMPPEQAMGGEVTPRSDLYSLGAMLYEMVTGRPPFLGDDSVAIIGQHINTPLVAPTWHNGQCPRPLEALIMRLLAKDPSERPDSATDVLSALDSIDLSESPPLARGDGGISDPHSLDSLAGGVFVGRQKEIGELKAALEDALSGRGRLVTLVGEPGIGKTRTALELATYAGLRQAQVLWGRCYEGEGAPPYWPWVQAIRSYVRDVDPEQLKSEMGAGAADIAEIVSDVSEQLPGLQAPPQLEPEQARFRLFDSITAFLNSAGRRKPLVLVLDDLHWADHPSLLLLEFVARELASARVMIIGTYRDMELSRQHPLSHTLGELNRERLFQRVLLRGLEQEDVARFIELASGVTPPTGMLEAVHRQTEGNPLFVTEVVRLLVQEGELNPEKVGQRDSWSVRIPEGVREVIGRRLDRLSERCNETLTTASVIGREFTLEHLAPLIEDITEDRLLDVLEEALSARVIEELPRTAGRYQFTHALIQETLAGELSTTRKVRLHARIAQSLEAAYGEEAGAHASELAFHFAEAQTILGTEKLVRFSILAGKRALGVHAHDEALTHFQTGLAGKEGRPMDAETAAILDGLGQAQMATVGRDQIMEAMDNLDRAFVYYVETGDAERSVAVALRPIPTLPGKNTGADRRTAQALTMVPPDSLSAGRLLALRGRVLGTEIGDYAGAADAFRRALTIAKNADNPGLELHTLAGASYVDSIHARWSECLERTPRAIELANKVDDPIGELMIRVANVWPELATGNLDAARRHVVAGIPVAERLRDRYWLCSVLARSCSVSLAGGEWQSAREANVRGLALIPTDPRLLIHMAALEFQTGNFEQGETYVAELLEAMSHIAPGPTTEYGVVAAFLPWFGRIKNKPFLQDTAEAAADAVLSADNCSPGLESFVQKGLAILAVAEGDVARASELYAWFKLSGEGVPAVGLPMRNHTLGLLAHTMGNLDLAATHFEDALVFCRNSGYRPEMAWACCD